MRSKKPTVMLACVLALAVAALVISGCDVLQKQAGATELERATVIRVVDGDTIVVQPESQEGPHKVRLIGIDTSEAVAPLSYLEKTGKSNSEEGAAASAHTKSLLPEETTVWLEKDVSDADTYGRLLRYVWLEEPTDPTDDEEAECKMLNAILVADGYATPAAYPPDTAHSELFEKLAKQAL